jgi:hypothetical protein
MRLTQSNGFAPFVGPQHNRQQEYNISMMVTQTNDNFNPYLSGINNSSSSKSQNNGNGSDRNSGTYNGNYDRANSNESRYDRYPYHKNESNYGKILNPTRFNDGGSVRVPTGQRPDSGSISSFAELSSPIKRQRLESSPQAVPPTPMQIRGLSPSNGPNHRTREEIEASAYSQGAKKGG